MQNMSSKALTIKLCDIYDNYPGTFNPEDAAFKNKVLSNYKYVLDNLNRKTTPKQNNLIQNIIKIIESGDNTKF